MLWMVGIFLGKLSVSPWHLQIKSTSEYDKNLFVMTLSLGGPEERTVEGPPDLSGVEQNGDWVTGTYR